MLFPSHDQVAAEGSNHTVSGVVVDASIDENKLATSVAGVGLAGGGGTALSVDLSEFSAVALASGDSFATLDSNGSTEQRTTIMDLGAYLAGGVGSNLTVNGSGQLFASASTSFTLDGDSGPTQTVDDGDTVGILGGNGITTAASAGENVTVTMDISEFSTAAVAADRDWETIDRYHSR